jgi:glucosamine--fructose-6-phosphate aminotransferase (isomerizing)
VNEMMLREILDQPAALANALVDLRRQAHSLGLRRPNRKIVLTGCGDSAIACLAVERLYRAWTDLEVRVCTSLEASRYEDFDPQTLVIAVSISGGVARTIEAAMVAGAAGAQTLAIVARVGSELGRISSQELLMPQPLARNTPHSRDYTLTLLALMVVLEVLADRRFDELDKWPELAQGVLNRAFTQLPAWVDDSVQTIFLGAGSDAATARYAALKFWEGGAMRAMSDELEEFAQGSQLMAAPGHSVVMLAGGPSVERALEFLPGMQQMELHARLVTDRPGTDDERTFLLPDLGSAGWIPLLSCLPMQVLAYLTATQRGVDVTLPMGGVAHGELYEDIHAEWTKRSLIRADLQPR